MINTKKNTIYIATSTKRSIAGGVIISGIYFINTDKLTHPILNDLYSQKVFLDYSGNIDPILDILEQDVDYKLYIELIPLLKLEVLGDTMAISRYTSKIVSRMICELSLVEPTIILCNQDSHGCIYYTYERKYNYIQSRYAYYLNMWQHIWWMKNYYHKLNSLYELDKNYGTLTINHMNSILYNGPDYRIHKRRSLKDIPNRWVSLVFRNDVWACTKRWHIKAPKWWSIRFPGYNFLHYSSECTFNKIIDILDKPYMHNEIYYWLCKEASSISIPSNLVRNKTIIYTIRYKISIRDKSKKEKKENIKEFEQLENNSRSKSRHIIDKYGFIQRVAKDIDRRE